MIAKNLKALLSDVPDDALIFVAGVACTEDVSGCIRSRNDENTFLLLAHAKHTTEPAQADFSDFCDF